jgi:hypothetical protein
MSEGELVVYLSAQFLIDFNASRGEFDFTIYRDRQAFRLRRLYGYYLKGPKRHVVASIDYMMADSIDEVVHHGRSFDYYNSAHSAHRHHVCRIALQ